ncbi:zinc finger protein 135-like isoform X2 [Megalobrama amblycephala]|uniref:zinc finger protein 135-like isoform X2 n=1 Tax=Megalobrama amblycephala TaxID=75352 RepID=UPI0020142533|nr:zinc finger protein 135-like isoform X2 [Megalobrama amblycephala]
MNIMNTSDFQSQLTSIMEIMARTAVAEISKLFEENSLLLRLEISRYTNENESLKKKCHFLESELQSARKTAGKMNGTEAPFSHPGHNVRERLDPEALPCDIRLNNQIPKLGGTIAQWVALSPHSKKVPGSTPDEEGWGKPWQLTHMAKDTGHRPTIDSVFGKEWCMNLWRHEESNVGEQEDDTHLDSSVISEEPVNLLDEEPDVIMIKEESLKIDDCSGKNKPEGDQSNSLKGPAMASENSCVAQSSEDFITYTVPSDEQVQPNIPQQPHAEEQTLEGTISTHEDCTAGSDLSPDVGFFPNNLSYNQMTVTQKKKLNCVFCGRTFEYLSHMTKHMRTHSGEKPFVCTVCGRRFAQKTYLTTHERTHSGERPYACMECGKSFSQKSSLNVHLRSHTGEKPFNCLECGKSYAYKIALKSHRCVS